METSNSSPVQLVDSLCRSLILGRGKRCGINNSNTTTNTEWWKAMMDYNSQASSTNSIISIMDRNTTDVITEKKLRKIRINCFSYLLDLNENVSSLYWA